jgi:hypothetical protein
MSVEVGKFYMIEPLPDRSVGRRWSFIVLEADVDDGVSWGMVCTNEYYLACEFDAILPCDRTGLPYALVAHCFLAFRVPNDKLSEVAGGSVSADEADEIAHTVFHRRPHTFPHGMVWVDENNQALPHWEWAFRSVAALHQGFVSECFGDETLMGN